MSVQGGRRLATALIGLLLSVPAWAADFPTKPVNLVVGFAAGGETDIVVRAMNDKLGEKLGQPAVVLNKVGSGGLVGADFVAKSKPDGYNLLTLSLSHILRQAADPQMPVNVLKDFEPEQRYTEKQVNEVLRRYNDDTAYLRRSLIEFKLMARDSSGAAYWRTDSPEAGSAS